MKAIILAAGSGNRLKPLTNDIPKCMVKFRGRPIIDYILDTLTGSGVDKITVVTGYKGEVLERYLAHRELRFYRNEIFDKSNMVYSLFCAEREFENGEDLIVTYSDIIYSKTILDSLIKSEHDISVIVDRKWRTLWDLRMQNPLEDAETLRLDCEGNIIELGKKPKDYSEIEGQYIGLIKFSGAAADKLKLFYKALDRNRLFDGTSFHNMYMTSFIQKIIDSEIRVSPVFINGGWLEIDTHNDLSAYDRVDLSAT